MHFHRKLQLVFFGLREASARSHKTALGPVAESQNTRELNVTQRKEMRGDSQITHVIILTDSASLQMKSGMGSPDWDVSMVDIHLQNLLWVYCPGHTETKWNGRTDRLAGKATISSGFRLGRSEMLRSLRHYCGHKSKAITPAIAWRRTIFLQRTRAGPRQSDEHWNCF